ncbi:MAG: protein kinase [Kofleriaceae bacterium]
MASPAIPPTERSALDRTATLGPRGDGDDVTATGGAAVVPPLGADELRVDDRYELVAEHGRGGLGRVMRAHDRRLGRVVAVKELLRRSALAESMFVREALITARLEHPGIVSVHEAGRWSNGDPFYVMKLVSGRTLKEVMADATTPGERLALLPQVIAVAEAVGYAHSEDVVHRDLKPANVLVGEFGETVVIDWGLARDLRTVDAVPLPRPGAAAPSGTPGPTITGRVIGTPQYMAPEQARGDAVGPAADVYAVGAILYELLAGRPAVEGDSVQGLLDRLSAGPPPPLAAVAPSVPRDLDAVVAKAMAREPGARYPTARELAADLKRFQTGQLVTAQRYGRWRLWQRWIVRHRGYVAMAAVAVAAIAAVAGTMLARVLDERRVAEARRGDAERARATAEAGEQALIVAQARAAMAADPTTGLAWLKRYAITPASVAAIADLVDEAAARGVARQVWPLADRPRGLVLTPDGGTVALGLADGRVRSYDTAAGSTRLLGEPGPPIAAAALAPDGHTLFVVDAGGAVATVALATGVRRAVAAIGATVVALRPLDDGQLVVRTADATVRCDPATGALTPLFAGVGKTDRLTEAFDGRHGTVRLAHGADGRIRRWRDAGPPTVIATVDGIARQLAISADGTRALVATTAALYLLDVDGGAVRQLLVLPAELYQITIDPLDRRAAVVGKGNDVYLVDLGTGAVEVLRGHRDGVLAAAFDARGERLVTAGDEGTVRVWDLGTGDVRELRGHDDDVVTVAISADGRTVLSTSFDDTMRVWRLDQRRPTVVGHLDDVRMVVALGGDRVRALTASDDAVKVVDVDLAQRTTAVKVAVTGAVPSLSGLLADGQTALVRRGATEVTLWHAGATRTVTFSSEVVSARVTRDGQTVVGADEDGRVWRADAAGSVTLAQAEPGAVVGLASDGRWGLVRDRTGFTVFEVTTGATVGRLDRQALGLTATAGAAFVPDDRRVAITGNPDVGIGMRLWDPAAGGIVQLEASQFATGVWVASPDHRWLASGIEGRALRLWDTATGTIRATLRGHRDGVFALAFSPDGTRLATASYDRTVRVWELATGDSRVLLGHGGPVWSVAWLDDARLVSASADGTVRAWTIAPFQIPSPAQLRARLEELTAAEIDPDHRARSPLPR